MNYKCFLLWGNFSLFEETNIHIGNSMNHYYLIEILIICDIIHIFQLIFVPKQFYYHNSWMGMHNIYQRANISTRVSFIIYSFLFHTLYSLSILNIGKQIIFYSLSSLFVPAKFMSLNHYRDMI